MSDTRSPAGDLFPRITSDCGCCDIPRAQHPDDCLQCLNTEMIVLPRSHYAEDITCPFCRPDAYPDGFPGLKSPIGTWLIEPSS